MAVLLFVAAYTAWQSYQLRQALTPSVRAEEEARVSGDIDKLRAFIDDANVPWRYNQTVSG